MIKHNNNDSYNVLHKILNNPVEYFDFEKYQQNNVIGYYQKKIFILISIKNKEIVFTTDKNLHIYKVGDYVIFSSFSISEEIDEKFLKNPNKDYIIKFLNKKKNTLINRNLKRKEKKILKETDEVLLKELVDYKIFDFEADYNQIIYTLIFKQICIDDKVNLKFKKNIDIFFKKYLTSDLQYIQLLDLESLNYLIQELLNNFDKETTFNILFDYKIALIKTLKYYGKLHYCKSTGHTIKIANRSSSFILEEIIMAFEKSIIKYYNLNEICSYTLKQKDEDKMFYEEVLKDHNKALTELDY